MRNENIVKKTSLTTAASILASKNKTKSNSTTAKATVALIKSKLKID